MTLSPRAESRADMSRRLAEFFSPRTIAIVGATENSVWTYGALHNARNISDRVYLVNPRRAEVNGRKAYPSIAALPEKIDLALVLTDKVEAVLEDAAASGLLHIAPIAANFADAGENGKARQDALVEQARRNGQLLLGPNNMGFINVSANAYAFSDVLPDFRKGGVGLVSQSGAMITQMKNQIMARDIGISHVITVGNEAMIDVVDCMNFLIDSPDCKVVAIFAESIRDPAAFLDAARRAFAAGKPVVACKIGRSEKGMRAAAAHTGGLASDDRIVDAAFRQFGVVRVDTVEDLVLTAAVLDEYGELPGRRTAIIAGSGAACGILCDTAEAAGVIVSDLTEETVRKLRDEILPPFAAAQNPLDFTAYAVVDPTLPRRSVQALTEDADADVVLHVTTNLPQDKLDPSSPSDVFRINAIQSMAAIYAASSKPVLQMDFFAVDYTPFARAFRLEQGLPFILPSMKEGIPALGRAMWWAERRREARGSAGATAIEPLIVADAGGSWSEARARDLLSSAGVPVVPAVLARDGAEAVTAAQAMGGPVALKLVSPDIAHKSDIGGVKLDVSGDDAVRTAYEAVSAAGASVAGAQVDGVLVSPMRREGVELLVGVVRDPEWGLVLAVGLGGIWVEIMKDSALRILPVDRREIRAMLDELKGRQLLEGARGQKPADMDRLVDTIASIAELAVRLGDRIDTIEVNPLLVHGDRIEALDALVVWNDDAAQVSEHSRETVDAD